jgi:hypothetical protein
MMDSMYKFHDVGSVTVQFMPHRNTLGCSMIDPIKTPLLTEVLSMQTRSSPHFVDYKQREPAVRVRWPRQPRLG